jgi:hypothetical protein
LGKAQTVLLLQTVPAWAVLEALMVKVALQEAHKITPEMAAILAAAAVVNLETSQVFLAAPARFVSSGPETLAPSRPLMSAHRKEK